jgi:hypothetical protein
VSGADSGGHEPREPDGQDAQFRQPAVYLFGFGEGLVAAQRVPESAVAVSAPIVGGWGSTSVAAM